MKNAIIVLCLLLMASCADPEEELKKQFQINNRVTVLDQNTKLMWAATDNQESLTWQEAVDYCKSYTAGGYEDWRMPKTAELAALFESGIHMNGAYIAISGERIWANEGDESKGAFYDFKNGRPSWGEKVMSITLHALPVRDSASSAEATAPAPSPSPRQQSPAQRLQILEGLHKQKLITDEEFNRKKAAILNEI